MAEDAGEKQKQIPFGNDNKKSIACSRRAFARWRSRWSRVGFAGDDREKQKQIPCGNDNKKSNSNGKSKDSGVADD